MKNYYQILGLEPSATKEEIKKAHREYAINFHPDKQGGSKFFEERFKEIQESYEVLSDDEKRANYDLKFNQRFHSQSYSSDNERERRERERKEQERKKQEYEKYDRAEPSKSLSSIRYDGVYYKKNNSYTSYLRFYSDGTVITASSTGTIIEIKRWFNKENSDISKGIYRIVEEKISFQSKSSNGVVEYNGQVYENKIILNSHSYINGYEEKNREYLFGSW